MIDRAAAGMSKRNEPTAPKRLIIRVRRYDNYATAADDALKRRQWKGCRACKESAGRHHTGISSNVSAQTSAIGRSIAMMKRAASHKASSGAG